MRELYNFTDYQHLSDEDYCSVTNGICRKFCLIHNKLEWAYYTDRFIYSNKAITFSVIIDTGVQFDYYKKSKSHVSCFVIREDTQ